MRMKDIIQPENLLEVSPSNLEAFIHGGAILGGGGGGWVEEGRKLGQVALERGFSRIHPLGLIPPDALLITVSAVGAPSLGGFHLRPEDYTRAVELLVEKTGLKPGGLISSEVGALGVVNGWVQSAALSIPLVDAPANGRAHPLGLMGAMGLQRKKGYISCQGVVSRDKAGEGIQEFFFSGPVEEVSREVLARAEAAGGMVAVARNPIPAAYVSRHGAPGALRMAFQLGVSSLSSPEPEKRLQGILAFFGDGVMIRGRVKEKTLRRAGGLDIGSVEVVSSQKRFRLVFWNEYMTLETSETRVAVFPDLLMTFEAGSAKPLISAEIGPGHEIYLLAIPQERILLGAGVRDRKLLSRIEKVVAMANSEPGGA